MSQASLDGTDGAYCVYQCRAGKVEFDIFYPAGTNAKEVGATEQTVLGEGGGKYQTIQLAGADAAHFTPSLADQPNSAAIVVRKGKAVFDIVIPRGNSSQSQLLDLARIVVSRIK